MNTRKVPASLKALPGPSSGAEGQLCFLKQHQKSQFEHFACSLPSDKEKKAKCLLFPSFLKAHLWEEPWIRRVGIFLLHFLNQNQGVKLILKLKRNPLETLKGERCSGRGNWAMQDQPLFPTFTFPTFHFKGKWCSQELWKLEGWGIYEFLSKPCF